MNLLAQVQHRNLKILVIEDNKDLNYAFYYTSSNYVHLLSE